MSQVNEISDNGTVLNHVLSIINACRISLENPSHGSCIVSSLAASDFLRSLGFAAETKSVVLSQSDIVNGQVRQFCGRPRLWLVLVNRLRGVGMATWLLLCQGSRYSLIQQFGK